MLIPSELTIVHSMGHLDAESGDVVAEMIDNTEKYARISSAMCFPLSEVAK